VATFLQCQEHISLCIADVKDIIIDGKSSPDGVALSLLPENKVSIAYQALALSRMLTVDDPSLKWDWKSGKPFGITFKVPGRLIQPINPDLAPTTCHFLFDGSQLMAFSTSLLDRLVEKDMKSIPTVKSTPNFPYRLGNSACLISFALQSGLCKDQGEACFVAETLQATRDGN
jgi:hypothetical protein